MRRSASPSARERQQLLDSLGRMLTAGLSATQAAATLSSSDREMTATLRSLRLQLEDGKSVAHALRRARLVAPLEYQLLGHAEQAGRVDAALSRLASRHARRLSASAKLRNQLIAPAAILVIMLLVGPLPKLAAGEISASGYAARALLPLVVIALLAVAVRRLLPKSRAHWREALPVIGPIMRNRSRLESLVSLHGLLEAGMPALDALAAMRDDYPAMAEAHDRVRRGDPVARALLDAALIDAAHGYPLVSAGEEAGQLVGALGRQVASTEEQQTSRESLLAQWLPRLVYAGVASVVAWQLVGSALFP